MKTIEAIYNEIKNSKELQEKLSEAIRTSRIADFFKELGYEGSMNDVAEYMKSLKGNGELSDDELDAVAGGANVSEALWSIFSFGIVCVELAIISACGDGVGDGPDGEILCNNEWNY